MAAVDRWWPIIVAVGTAAALRLVDYLLPKGRHLSLLDRFTKPDDEKEGDE